MTLVANATRFRSPRHLALLLGLVFFTLLLLTIGNMAIHQTVDAEAQSLYESELLPITHIKEANAKLFDIERNLKRVIIAQAPELRAEARNEVLSGERILLEEIAKARVSISRPENVARIAAIEILFEAYKNNVARALIMMEPANAHGDNPIEYILGEDFQKVVRSTDQLFDQIAESKLGIAHEKVEIARLAHERVQMISLLVLLLALAGGIVAMRYSQYGLAPFDTLSSVINALSLGRTGLTIPFTEEQGPFGEMARAIDRIQENIKDFERRLMAPSAIGHASTSDAEGLIESHEESPTEISYKKVTEFGSTTSPLCRSSHDYMAALGETLYLQGELIEAEKPLRSALVLIPHSSPVLNTLARIYYSRGLFVDAEACLRRTLGINPWIEDALYLLIATLNSTGRPDAAEEYLRKLLSINPQHEGALLFMKHFLSQTGRFERAETVVGRAIAINPSSPTGLVELVSLRKMTLADSDWLNSAEEQVKIALPSDEFQLRYAMGKYCDDINDYDRAFANYQRANQLSKALAGNPFIPENWTRNVDRLIQANSQPRLRRNPTDACASERPVFIVGMPRSGTSLVEQIVASHPSVFGAGELPFWGRVANSRSTSAMDSRITESTLLDLATQYLSYLLELDRDASRVVDKMPDNFARVGLIHAVFPNAKFIHTMRNPIDTCLSIYFQNFTSSYRYSRDLADLAHYYREYHRLMAHWRAILPEGTLLDLRYEDLLADQEGVSRKMIEFIGLDWDAHCLSYQDTERRVATASKWQVRQQIYTSSVERWRNYEKFIEPLMELKDLRH